MIPLPSPISKLQALHYRMDSCAVRFDLGVQATDPAPRVCRRHNDVF